MTMNNTKEKKPTPFCIRCGVDNKKGYREGRCSCWGVSWDKHIWNNSKKLKNIIEPDVAEI